MHIAGNYQIIQNKVRDIAIKAGRDPEEIQIIAVSKTFPEKVVQQAINSGITVFGENKVQEAKRKKAVLTGIYKMHMIGHLQSNKAKDAVELFDLIHSIDKLSTAERLNKEAETLDKLQDILVQIKTSPEETKSGIDAAEAESMLEGCLQLPNINVLGFMTMAPFTDNESIIRKSFATTRDLLDKINNTMNLNLKELSMGMSSDFKYAIQEGATMVRIGTAIFGERTYY